MLPVLPQSEPDAGSTEGGKIGLSDVVSIEERAAKNDQSRSEKKRRLWRGAGRERRGSRAKIAFVVE